MRRNKAYVNFVFDGAMGGYFRISELTSGIIHGVQKAGDLLAEHFPRLRRQAD